MYTKKKTSHPGTELDDLMSNAVEKLTISEGNENEIQPEPEPEPEPEPDTEPEPEPEPEPMPEPESKETELEKQQKYKDEKISNKSKSLYDLCIEIRPDIKKIELSGCFSIDKRDKEPLRINKNIIPQIYVAYIDNKQKCLCNPISEKSNKRGREECKVVLFKTFPYKTEIEDALDEISMLDILNGHPNLMEFYGIYKLPPADELLKLFGKHESPLDCYDTVAVFERGLGNVHSHLKKFKKMFHKDNDKLFGHSQNTELILFQYISRDILEGLEHIHKLGYVHLDLKPENICIFRNHIEDQPEPEMQQEHKITRKYIFKIIDLGSCRRVGEELESTQGTYTTAPPEMLISEKVIKSEYSFDYYSFGVVLYYIYKNHFPLNSEGKGWRLDLVKSKRGFNDAVVALIAGSETMEKDHSIEAKENRRNDFLDVGSDYIEEYHDNYNLIIELYDIIEGLISIEPAERYKYIEVLKNLLSKMNHGNLIAKLKSRKTVKKSKKRKTRKLKQKKTAKKNKKRKTRKLKRKKSGKKSKKSKKSKK